MSNYVIASSKDWFDQYPKSKEYNRLNIVKINNKDDLNLELLRKINPRYIFFPHWNWKVSAEIYEQFDCVVFHTAPLPFGRGGSPIQNLILCGFKKSPVCALKMTGIIDGGPIYDSVEISLDGDIVEIFNRIAKSIESLIISICINHPSPQDQQGEVVEFKRLSENDGELLSSYSINNIYDRIRMVDGFDYPKAFINFGNIKIQFSDAQCEGDILYAKVKFIKNDH